MSDNNCAGCKWLDQVQHWKSGVGCCYHVVCSKNYKGGDRVRYADMQRCELYEVGDWKTRHEKKKMRNDESKEHDDGWVSVEDRLPADEKEVLVCTNTRTTDTRELKEIT